MGAPAFFEEGFVAVMGRPPFEWQRRLFERFAAFDPPGADLPAALDIPTGLGKTAVIAIWLLALAWQAEQGRVRLPRRLLYVVDRRTVVDQATDVAEGLRAALGAPAATRVRAALAALRVDVADDASPLAISTLRGERADNREWQADPARATIVIATVDMAGSRVLFSGYGVSPRMRPFHAGLLGHDALVVHDEAHLSPAFGVLMGDLAERQRGQNAPRPPLLLELTATRRAPASGRDTFALTAAEAAEEAVAARLAASKRLRLVDLADGGDVAEALAAAALAHEDARCRVLVYVRAPADAAKVAERLIRLVGKGRADLLTGTIRGFERDRLVVRPLFAGFRARPGREAPAATEYLVATSAGEVGVDLDADHLVCDLGTLDSMIQRLGRVNRLGAGDADVVVVSSSAKAGEDLAARLAATRRALATLPVREDAHDASPAALRNLVERLRAEPAAVDGEAPLDRCFSWQPRLAVLTDILLDNWSLTRVKDLPGRPLPERWLHGVESGEPDVTIAWREEIEPIVWDSKRKKPVEDAGRVLGILYDKHGIRARERLRGPVSQVVAALKQVARRAEKESEKEDGAPPLCAVLLPVRGDPVANTLSALIEDSGRLANATILLPTRAGGLDGQGMLDGNKAGEVEDVADLDEPADAKDTRRRVRALLQLGDDGDRWTVRLLGRADDAALSAEIAGKSRHTEVANTLCSHLGMARKALLVLRRDEDGRPTRLLQLLAEPRSAATAEDDTAAAARPQPLRDHSAWAADEAETIVRRLGLDASEPRLAEAIVIAARWHDRGKDRPEWQRAIGHAPPAAGKPLGDWAPWAKSGRSGFDDSASGRYRHEFGSLRQAAEDATVGAHPERDLILHLIAAHHGWARPHFRPDHGDIAVSDEQNAALAAETMRRFARLQRRFGHWGLAWLESLVRAADYAATERLGKDVDVAPIAAGGVAETVA